MERSEPEAPAINYLPEGSLFVSQEILGKTYNLLQGHPKDNEILILLNVKHLVEIGIVNNTAIIGKYISSLAEVRDAR